MQWNVAPEYVSLILISILIVSSWQYRIIPTLKNRLFRLCLHLAFYEILISIISIIGIENYQIVPRIANIVIQIVFFLVSPLMVVLFMFYLVAVIWEDDTKIYTYFRIIIIPYLLYAVLVLTNPVTGLLYDIGESDGFIYGKMYFFVYIIPIAYIIAMIFIIITNRRKIEISLKLILLSFPIISLIMLVFQWIFPNIILSGSAITSALLIVYLYLQNKQVALIDSQRESMQRYKKLLDGTIIAFSKAMEVRDPYTSGHQIRVSKLATAISEKLDINSSIVEIIRITGLLHDIGKMYVPAEILSKSTKLSDLEYSMVKVHSEAGYNILKSIDFDGPIAEIVYQHHEKMDGSGYPRQLKGEQILKEARILCVADVVEAMISNRPYRPALGLDAALAEVEQGAGTKYDADCVRACVKLFREDGFEI